MRGDARACARGGASTPTSRKPGWTTLGVGCFQSARLSLLLLLELTLLWCLKFLCDSHKDGRVREVPIVEYVVQSCLTLCNVVDCSPPGSSVHGILQARITERVAIPFSRGSSRSGDRTQVSHTAGRVFTV